MKKMYSEPKLERFEFKVNDIIKTSPSNNYEFTVKSQNDGAQESWIW